MELITQMFLRLLCRVWSGKDIQMLPRPTKQQWGNVLLGCPLACCNGTLILGKELCLQVTGGRGGTWIQHVMSSVNALRSP